MATVIGTTSEKAARPTAGHQDVEDLLGGVGARREVVGGEHRERGGLAEPLVLELVAVQRRAEQLALQPVADAVGRQRDDVGRAGSGRRERRSAPSATGGSTWRGHRRGA